MRVLQNQNSHDENVAESRDFASDPSMKGVFSTQGSEANQANRLLGNRQAFMQNTNAVNQPDGKPRDTMQTNTTNDNSEYGIE